MSGSRKLSALLLGIMFIHNSFSICCHAPDGNCFNGDLAFCDYGKYQPRELETCLPIPFNDVKKGVLRKCVLNINIVNSIRHVFQPTKAIGVGTSQKTFLEIISQLDHLKKDYMSEKNFLNDLDPKVEKLVNKYLNKKGRKEKV